MLETIKNIKNPLPFYYFEQISKIPRASGNERGMVEYIKNIANGTIKLNDIPVKQNTPDEDQP